MATAPASTAVTCDQSYVEVLRIPVRHPVYASGISASGHHLALGGPGGLRLYSIPEAIRFGPVRVDPVVYGDVTVLKWAYRCEAPSMLVTGTLLGWLHMFVVDEQNNATELYKCCIGDGVEVLSLACDVQGITVRIVAGMKSGMVARIDCDEHKISFKWGKQFQHVVPKMVAFCQADAEGAGGDNILALGLWDGMAHVIDGEPESELVLASRPLTKRILSATAIQNDLLIDFGDGFSLMNLESGISMASFVPDDGGAAGDEMFARQCGFLESNTKIVVGSHSGDVHIYDRAGGYPKYLLRHSPGYPARTVSTWESATKCMVVTASNSRTPHMSAALWVLDFRGRQRHSGNILSVQAAQCGAEVRTTTARSTTAWQRFKSIANFIIDWTIRLGVVALLYIVLANGTGMTRTVRSLMLDASTMMSEDELIDLALLTQRLKEVEQRAARQTIERSDYARRVISSSTATPTTTITSSTTMIPTTQEPLASPSVFEDVTGDKTNDVREAIWLDTSEDEPILEDEEKTA